MNSYKVVLNNSVYKKLEDILSYISLESPTIASDIINGIEQKIMSLSLAPERFVIVPENINYKIYQVRHCFYKKSFRIIYSIRKDVVHILDVRHSVQDYISQDDIT